MDEQNTQNPSDVTDIPDQTQGSATGNVKQQIVESINGAKNVLVTVSANPGVDELAAALGLTFMLGKLDKHATAVFSGKIPPAMEFLDPEKTFESNVDSLRDFIIALDKEKADKLRYKVEDDVVKIFITPYKTTLKKEDFNFSQGDFNVDVVIALGVQKREDLDKAITAHGRILHDATVITINTAVASSLGAVDWTDQNASSVAEMLISISESFGGGLLDEQISTAFLTGIVAATNRFSNEKTSPKVMTMAAQLMAAGANQQLVATNLRREGMITEAVRTKKADQPHEDDGELELRHDTKKKQSPKQNTASKPKPQPNEKSTPGTKKNNKPSDEVKSAPPKADTKDATTSPVTPPAQSATPPAPASAAPVAPPPVPSPDPGAQPSEQPNQSPTHQTPAILPPQSRDETDKPLFGGTLNATTASAEEAKREQAAREAASNNVSLSHGDSPAASQAAEDAIAAARQAVDDAAEATPFNPANNPTQGVGAIPLPGTDPLQPSSQAVHPVDTDVMDRQMGSAPPATPPVPTEPSPIESFMQPHADGVKPPEQQTATPDVPLQTSTPPPAPTPAGDVPPLPPLPPVPSDGSMPPPLPPLPGQPQSPATSFQPQTSPDFMQSVNQSQNSWTEAGQDIAAKQADKDAARQEKMDTMAQQYDAAVDKNRELQGKPPLNNDHTTFPLPPTPPSQ